MPANNISAGMSNAPLPSSFQNQGGYSYSSLGAFGGFGSDPTSVIENAVTNRQLQNYQYPPDLPKYHFTIIETDYKRLTDAGGLSGAVSQAFSGSNQFTTLESQKRYKLPLPHPLTDSFEVQYEQDFSYLEAAAKSLEGIFSNSRNAGVGSFVRGLTEGIGQAGRAGGAAAGLTLNQFKTVTMSTPKYRTFQFSWKFAPKTFQEAREIQRLMYSLRRGMSPSTGGNSNEVINRALLHFPKIFLLYFSPNAKYLYKFKPCVLTSLVIDYNGGNPSPAFYKASGALEHSPPEAVTMSTSWLELEYWLDSRDGQGDYKDDGFGLPTNDPFDGFNTYTLDQTVTTNPAGNQTTQAPGTNDGTTTTPRRGPTGSLSDGIPRTYEPQ